MLRDATNSTGSGSLKTFQRREKATGAQQPADARQPPAALPESTPAAPGAPDDDEASPQAEDTAALLRDSSLAADAPGWMLRGLSCRRSSVLMPFASLLEVANYLARRKGTRKQRDQRQDETRKLIEELCRQFAEIDAFELVCESPGHSPDPPKHRHRNRSSRRKHASKPSAPRDAAGTSCPPAAAAPSPGPRATPRGASGEQHVWAPPPTSNNPSTTSLDVGPSRPGALGDRVASTPAAASPRPPCSSPAGRRDARATASSVPPDPLTDAAACEWKSSEGDAEGMEPLSLLASPLSSPPPASNGTSAADVCLRTGPLGRVTQAAGSSVGSGVLSSGRRSCMPSTPSQLEQQQEQATVFHVGHSSGTQQLEEEQEEEEVEEAEGLRVEGRLSVLQDSTGKRDGEGEDSCTDTAHAEGGAVEERAASGAAASVPSPPAPPQPDLPPLHRLLALCGQQVPAIAAHDDGATGPGRPRRPARRRDADARDQQQQPHDPLLQQLPTMEGVLAQLVEVVAAGAAGAPQEAAGGKKGGRGKGGKARVIKVGEGSYGEAWRLCCPRAGGGGGGGRGVVVKVVPIEGEEEFNGGPQKRAAEMLCETLVCRAVSGLADPQQQQQLPEGQPVQQAGDRGGDGPALPAAAGARCGPCPSTSNANATCGFVRTHAVAVCRGPYPKELVKEWERWDAAHGSENDPVGSLPPHQLYWVIAMEDGGTDLEKYPLANMDQARSVLLQVGLSLAVAEAALCFEHRDLHWGNVLVRGTQEREGREQEEGEEEHEQLVAFRLLGKDLKVRSCGVVSSVIDFTQSRLTAPDGSLAFTDLAADPAVFEGPEGNVQFDTYRWMRGLVGDDWSAHVPATNCLWLAYLAEILAQQKQFGPPAGAGAGRGAGGVWRPSAGERRRLREFRRRALSYTSCSQLLQDELFGGLLVEGA